MKARSYIFSTLLSICFFELNAQFEPPAYNSGSGVNSVTVFEATTPEKNDYTLLGKAPLQTKQTTQYLDGLGRVIQTVSKQASPLGKDIVVPVYYDNLGQTPYNFFPFVSTQTPAGAESTTDGTFKLNPFQQQKAFYQTQLAGQGETFYYSQVETDGSPLNRITKSFQSGASWIGNNKYGSVSYDFNKSTENVHIWNLASNTSLPTTTMTQVHATGTLSKIISLNEDGEQVITYTDLEGNIILKKIQEKGGGDLTNEHSGWACTYYVYDDYNQLRFIIPPKAVAYLDNNGWNLSNDIVNELCFKYEYDERGRVVIKIQPGAGEVNMVYDGKDRVVFIQDANLNKSINLSLTISKWLFNLYDEYDRVIATGLVENNLDRQSLQNMVNNLSSSDIITISAFVGNGTYQSLVANCPVAGYSSNDSYLSNSNIIYNSITHYDSYEYQGVKPFSATYTLAYTPPSQNTENLQSTDKTLGVVTGEKIRIIDNDNDNSNDQFIFSTAYYDDRGRSIQTLTTNIKGGIDYATNQYDFAGRLMSTYQSHSDGIETYTIISKNEYDKDGRLTSLYKNFNNSFSKQLAEYSYDELGRLKRKRLAPGYIPPSYLASNKQEIESQDFTYNVHGSLIGINKDYALSTDNSLQWDHYFGLYLGYDNKDNLFTQGQLTGNITGTIWKSQGDNSMRKYNFTYDNLGRFRTALFLQKKKPSDGWSNTEIDFSVYADYEDLNGNLKSLKQMGVVPGTNGIKVMDDLRYYYKDAGSAAGLTGNQLKRIDDNLSTLTSNGMLNDFKDGSNASGTDDYDYDVNGNLTQDANKNIASGGIIYNFLNKPVKITLQNKSVVEYTYDASGEKLTKKETNSVTGGVVLTHYMGDFVYEEVNSQLNLKYILHEEGRVKIITPVNNSTTNSTVIVNNGSAGFVLSGGRQGVFEYFIKDHLSNTRVVLTEEVQQEVYRSYMESASAGFEEQVFGKVTLNPDNTVTVPSDNELKRARTSNSQVSTPWPGNNTEFVKLSAANSKLMGPNILLKVMAGDVINASAKYFYYNNDPTSGTSTPVNDAASSLIAALTGSNATSLGKVLSSDINSNLTASGGDFAGFVNTTQPNSGPATAPKAYLNIVFLDEQFKFIPGEGISGAGSMAQKVSIANNGSVSFNPMVQKAPKNGWVYVYLSNESSEPVYFDDFFVTQNHSLISEESHYYPHGLKIAALTSHAFNKLENGYGYQGDFSEEETESEFDEFDLRMYDPQIGRWISVDPYDEFPSPYIGMGNDPVNNSDVDGGGIFDGTNLATRTFAGALGGYIIGGIAGELAGDESGKYAVLGAAIGGASVYSMSQPLSANFYIGPTWSMVKEDAGDLKLKNLITSAYFGTYLKSMIMEVLSLGKVVTVHGSTTSEINEKVNKYFERHPNAHRIANATIEFHAGDYGKDDLSEHSFETIGKHFDENSVILMGNCFCGSKEYLDDISRVTNGATVIGHYGYQNDLTFLLNGSLTGGSPRVMNEGYGEHLDDRMFVHNIAHGGQIVESKALLTTHIANSGKITYKHLSASFVKHKLDFWGKTNSKLRMIFEAIFNPTN
jgi:RHS repeat-associated protein